MNNRSVFGILLLGAMAGAAPISSAIAQSNTPAADVQPAKRGAKFPWLRLALSAGATTLDRDQAAAQQVHSQSFTAGLEIGAVVKRLLFVGADFGYLTLSDHAAFTQSTTGGDRKSTAGVAAASFMAGAQTPSARLIPGLPAIALGLSGGTTITAASRSIDSCLDCVVQDLDIPGGTFVQPSLIFGRGNTRLRISNRHYLAAEGMRFTISAGVEVGGASTPR